MKKTHNETIYIYIYMHSYMYTYMYVYVCMYPEKKWSYLPHGIGRRRAILREKIKRISTSPFCPCSNEQWLKALSFSFARTSNRNSCIQRKSAGLSLLFASRLADEVQEYKWKRDSPADDYTTIRVTFREAAERKSEGQRKRRKIERKRK